MVAGIAGQLGPVPLAVHGVFMSTSSIFYLTANAIALATSTIAGNHLGDVSWCRNFAHNGELLRPVF